MKKILVKIYLWYLRFFARMQLRKLKPLIVGVGGASGKSSTALLISEVLGQKFSLKQSKGKNSETGVPLSILGIELRDYNLLEWAKVLLLVPWRTLTNNKKYDIYVIEMGIDSPLPPKNMEYLLSIVKPSVGVLTNIDIEHSAYFDPLVNEEDELERKNKILKLISRQEGLLLESINESGSAVVNLDDPNIKALLPLRSKTITISSKDNSADFYLSKISVDRQGFSIQFEFLKEKYQIQLPQPLPEYFAYSFILAIATSFVCGVSVDEAIGVIESNFTLPPGRFSVFKGIKNSTILDSSYNSSLEPAIGAIELLSKIGKGRRVGILGDMRELGSLSKIQHEILAKAILGNLDFAIIIGPMISEYVSPILTNAKFPFIAFQSFKEAKNSILENIKQDDLILVKGSQNTLYLERVVEILLDDKNDSNSLCRRGEFWDKVRKETSNT